MSDSMHSSAVALEGKSKMSSLFSVSISAGHFGFKLIFARFDFDGKAIRPRDVQRFEQLYSLQNDGIARFIAAGKTTVYGIIHGAVACEHVSVTVQNFAARAVSFKYVAEDCTASSSNVLPSKSCHWASRPIYKRKTAASITPQKI